MDGGFSAERRRLLAGAVSATGALGVVSAAYPFVRSWTPSERAKALGGPIEIYVGAVEPGGIVKVLWRGRPVYVVRRPPALLEGLSGADALLVDPRSEHSEQPDYARNEARARNPEFLVVLGVCTHAGCAPEGVLSGSSPRPDVVPTWTGGFFCACHGSVYDAAGRVYKNVPAPANLPVPPYYFASATRIVVGLSAPAPTEPEPT